MRDLLTKGDGESLLELNFFDTPISMTGKDEKARRKEILYSQRDEKRRLVREGLPVSAPMMKALFDYIDEHLSSAECDHSLRHGSEFIHTNLLPKEAIIAVVGKGGRVLRL